MNNLNIDQIIQQKLQMLNIDYKTEYWDKMEKKLESGSTGSELPAQASKGSFSSNIMIASVAAAVTVLTLVYVFTKEDKVEPRLLASNQPISTENQLEPKQVSSYSAEAKHLDPCTEIAPATAETEKSIAANHQSKTHKLAKKSNQNMQTVPVLSKEILDSENNSESIIVAESLSLNHEPIIVEEVKSTTTIEPAIDTNSKEVTNETKPIENNYNENAVSNNQLIHVTPIDKPVKRVFKERHGILWHLGFRK
jgi:hypothetical protein